jgi:hypothetical protein
VPAPRRIATALAAPLLVSSILAACAFDAPLTVTASGTQQLDVPVAATAPDLEVRVEMFNGPIEVRAGVPGLIAATVTTTGAGASKADAEADRARIQVSLDVNPDGTVLLRAVYQPNPSSPDNRSASAVVDVPPGSALALRTSNGDVTTTGVAGPADAQTSNGVVRLAGATAGATVRTSNGHVEVEGGGPLDIETSNAAILIQGAGATVRAATSNGQISFDGTLSDAAQAMETSNERIDLRLPADASFGLDARTTNAEVTLDGFDIRTTGAASGSSLQGTVGTGGPSITLRTSNNPIVVSAQ